MPEIWSGVFEGKTDGTPIGILFRNSDQRSGDYGDIKDKYRPGHADFTFDAKYGFRDYRGGGRSSARETVCRVAAGAIAKKLLAHARHPHPRLCQAGRRCVADIPDPTAVTLEQVEATPVRCPDPAAAERMIALIEEVRKEQDSIGGFCELVAVGVPAGLGEPVFDKLKADLAKALLSLPAVTAFEYGAGFGVGTLARQREQRPVHPSRKTAASAPTPIATAACWAASAAASRSSAGSAIKPTSSLPRPQRTVTRDGRADEIATRGRHDPCLLPRFVPMGEAMMALVLVDHWLRLAWAVWQGLSTQRKQVPRSNTCLRCVLALRAPMGSFNAENRICLRISAAGGDGGCRGADG